LSQYPLGAGSVPLDSIVASVGGNEFLYVLSANATSVDVLSLKGLGKASHLQRFNIRSGLASSGSQVPINGNSLQGMAAYVMGK
ncbi:hypothetical protein FRC08_010555, partial [Ceratobasidium sp. 394]